MKDKAVIGTVGLIVVAVAAALYGQTKLNTNQIRNLPVPPTTAMMPLATFAAPDLFVVQDPAAVQNFTARSAPIGPLYVFRNGVLQMANLDYVPPGSTGYTISFAPGVLQRGDTITLLYQVAGVQWIAVPIPPPGTNGASGAK